MALRLIFVISTTLALVHGAVRYNSENFVGSEAKRLKTGVQYKDDLHPEIQARQIQECVGRVPANLVAEIAGYKTIADRIIDTVRNGAFKGRTYLDLAELVDKYPTRLSGFQTLENSIDFMMDKMKNVYNLEHVRGEQVVVPHWVRYVSLLSPAFSINY